MGTELLVALLFGGISLGSASSGPVNISFDATWTDGGMYILNPVLMVYDGGSLPVTFSGNFSMLMIYDGGALPTTVANPVQSVLIAYDGGPLPTTSTVSNFPAPVTSVLIAYDGGPLPTTVSNPVQSVLIVYDGGGLPTTLASVPTHAVTQSGAWNFSLLGLPDGGALDLEGVLHYAQPWNCNVSAATASTQCQAAPVSGKLYVKSATVSNGPTAQNIKVVQGTGAACVNSQVVLGGPYYLAVNGPATVPFDPPIPVANPDAGVCCIISGSTAYSCTLNGFTN